MGIEQRIVAPERQPAFTTVGAPDRAGAGFGIEGHHHRNPGNLVVDQDALLAVYELLGGLTADEVVDLVQRCLQVYRDEAKPKQRTPKFMDKFGADAFREAVLGEG